MPDQTYMALVAFKNKQDEYDLQVQELRISDLPQHDVLVHVRYSSLNYKDALSATGHKGVTSTYPHTPGIDAAGIVEESGDDRFSPGDPVIVTSYGLGEDTPGGFGQYIRVPGDWIVPLPKGLKLRESMIYGTAGFTAAYGVQKILDNVMASEDGPILVTGATGGVGSMAVGLLSQNGFSVMAATGKTKQSDFLKMLGASEVVHRDQITQVPEKPLLKSRWAGAIDTVGGAILDAVIRQTSHEGTVACCGNILGGELSTSIYPFILRGINLMGIDSGQCPMPKRKAIWGKLSDEWKLPILDQLARVITLDELKDEIKRILRGDQTGRILLNLN